MKRIYLDYAALTPIDKRVLDVFNKDSANEFANPSSIYKEGVQAKKIIDAGRISVAKFLGAHADEIVFTSGGTEANGLVLEGCGRVAHRNGITKPHIVISNIEHSSIMETANMLEKHGVEVTRLAVDQKGQISLDELKKSLKPSTYLVSIIMVNNEIGSVSDIRGIAKVVRDYKKEHGARSTESVRTSNFELRTSYPLLHTDAAQAVLHYDLNVEKLGVDFLTIDSSKMYGPRSIGAIFIRRNSPIEQIIYGGGQERGLRSGTENVAAIAGFAKACELIEHDNNRIQSLKNQFVQGLKDLRPDIIVNSRADGSPHILNVSIPGIDNEFFVLQLDVAGVACSTKSSCLRDEDESYVLKAIGALSKTSIRFSFGRWTTGGDIKKVLKLIKRILAF